MREIHLWRQIERVNCVSHSGLSSMGNCVSRFIFWLIVLPILSWRGHLPIGVNRPRRPLPAEQVNRARAQAGEVAQRGVEPSESERLSPRSRRAEKSLNMFSLETLLRQKAMLPRVSVFSDKSSHIPGGSFENTGGRKKGQMPSQIVL
jgi:hypothetical protein